LSKKVVDFVKKTAEEVQRYRRAVEGHTVSVHDADNATAGLIDTIELHRQAARLEAAGIRVTAGEFRSLAVAATDYARRTGDDVTQSFDRLTTSVIGAESRGLRRYGVTLQRTGDLSQRQAAIIGQFTERFHDQTVEIQDTQEAIFALENAWGTAWSEMVLTLERSGGALQHLLADITEGINDVATALETQRRAQEGLAVSALLDQQGLLQHRRQAAISALEAAGISRAEADRYSPIQAANIQESARAARQSVSGGTSLGLRVAVEGGVDMTNAQAQAVANYRLVQEQLVGIEQQLRDAEQHRDEVRAARSARPARPTPAAPTGGGRHRPPEGLSSEYGYGYGAALMEAIIADARVAADQAQEDLARDREKQEADFADYQQRMLDEAEEAQRARAKAAEESADRQVAAAERVREAVEATQAAYERVTSSIQKVGEITQYAGKISDTVSGIVIASSKNQEEAQKKAAKVKGAFVIAESVVGAALETAKAVASFAEQDYLSGAMHIAAAALYAAVAVKAAVELGASSKSGGTTTTARHEYTAPGSTRNRGEQPQVININTYGPVTSQRVQDDLDNAARGSRRRYD